MSNRRLHVVFMANYRAGRHKSSQPPVSANDIDLIESFRNAGLTATSCLLAWLRWRQTAGEGPASVLHIDLAPTQELSEIVLGVLQTCRFIAVASSARSPLRTIIDAGRSTLASAWVLDPVMVNEPFALNAALAMLMKLEPSEDVVEEALHLWQVLAVAECCSYLAAELEEHHLERQWAATAEPVIARIVEVYPVSQAFYLCWLSVRDIASAYLKYPHSRGGLPHTLRSSLDNKVRRAQAEGWTLRSFNRHPRCSQSALAAVFANEATTLGDEYLDVVPSRTYLGERLRGR